MKNLLILFATLQLFSCNKESVNDEKELENPNDTIVEIQLCDTLLTFDISDEDLFDIAYSSSKFYDGFYSEEEDGSLSLMNKIKAYRSDESTILCTDDFEIAAEWDENADLNSSYYRELVSQSETDKYYKFRRVNPDEETDVVLDLVLKCTYLDCSQQRLNENNVLEIGTFNQTPYTIENCLELVEFWKYQGYYNISNIRIISNATCETKDVVQIALFETNNIYGDWDEKDTIYLKRLLYTINKKSGLFTLETIVLKSIEGKISTPSK